MILCDRHSTSYDLASLFVAGAVLYRDGMENRKSHWHEAVSSALNFPFLKDVLQNRFVFMLCSSKIKEVSQKSFAFQLSTSNFQGCLAE